MSDHDDVQLYEGTETTTHVRVVRYLTINYDVTPQQAEQLATKHKAKVEVGNILGSYTYYVGDAIAHEEHLAERI